MDEIVTAANAGDAFWQQQHEDKYREHVREINEYVDDLRAQRGGVRVPHVAPLHGGNQASALSVLADPGPRTEDTGMLCVRNPDPTSRVQRQLMNAVNLRPVDLTPWNAYPWIRPFAGKNQVLTAKEREAGEEALIGVICLMPALRVLFLQGDQARTVGLGISGRLALERPEVTIVHSCHPLGTRRRTPPAAEEAKKRQLMDWQKMAALARVCER